MSESGRGRGKCGVLGDPTWPRWRLVALGTAALALLLAVGLATTLGVSLAKTECGAPPLHAMASTTYRGTAPPGTSVTYVCPFPLVFPDNERNYTVTCSDDLQWSGSDLPACVRSGERHCALGDGLSLVTRDTGSAFEVDLLLRAPVPSSILADVSSEDQQGLCSYVNLTAATEGRERSRRGAFVPRSLMPKAEEHFRDEVVHTVRVTDDKVEPGEPYEVRVRGIGGTVAVSLLQDAYINSVIKSLEIEATPTTTTTPKTTVAASATSPPTTIAYETPKSTTPSVSTSPTATASATSPTMTESATAPLTTTVASGTTTSTMLSTTDTTQTTAFISSTPAPTPTTSTPSEPLPTSTILAFASSTPHSTIIKPSVTTYASTTT
ncbi:mucin-6-like [Penaeus japonicus]|uniref:mucin-6-like n=1 Tax=Penaeus japonicus TaxID=27405 RepID=UPI001C712BF3|nr:mucin-6-like [Penaeus japonicus]